ncbi:Maturase [Trichinella pseudospiralis]
MAETLFHHRKVDSDRMLLQLFTVQFPTIHLAARQAHPGRVWALPIRICDLLVHLLFSLLVHHHHRWQQTVIHKISDLEFKGQ